MLQDERPQGLRHSLHEGFSLVTLHGGVALDLLHVFSPGGTQLKVQPSSRHATLLADRKCGQDHKVPPKASAQK